MVTDLIKAGDLPHCTEAVLLGKWDVRKAEQVLSHNWWQVYQDPGFDFDHPEVALNEPAPAMSTIRCYKGKAFAIDLIFTILTEFVTSYSVGKGTTSAKLKATAARIYSRWYYLKVSEFKFVLSQAKRTHKVYDAIDGNTVERLFEAYDLERTSIAGSRSVSENESHKSLPGYDIAAFIESEQIKRDIESRARIAAEKDRISRYEF